MNTKTEKTVCRPDGVIISVPRQYHRAVEFAAEELAKYFNAMTGSEAEIVHEPGTGGPACVRFETDKTLKADGYGIRCEADIIIISGGNPRGCLFGAYAFLGELGCRFPLPGKKYEVVPKRADIAWPGTPIRTEPAIGTRGIIWGDGKWDDDLWDVIDFLPKNRFNSILLAVTNPVPEELAPRLKSELISRDLSFEWGTHTLPGYLPRDLFDEHPEYFRMEEGKRTPKLNMCPSCTPAVEIIAGFARKDLLRFRDIPGLEVFHCWPDDLFEGGWCGCDDCAGLTPSDQALKIINEVALRLPLPEGASVAHLVYHATIEAPKNIRPVRNVSLLYAPRERCYRHSIDECETNRRYLGWLKDQLRCFPDKPEVFEYYLDCILFRQLPMPLHTIIGQDVKKYRELGIDRIMTLSFPVFSEWTYGPNYYVLAKALWRGAGDSRDIKEYCKAMYGSAAGLMEQYFDLIFELCATSLETCGYTGFADMRWPPNQDFTAIQVAQLAPLVEEAHFDAIELVLAKASAVADESCKERVAAQLALWKVARIETLAIYRTLVLKPKSKQVLEGHASETEWADTVELTRQTIAGILEAGELLLTEENKRLGGSLVFREGGMVGDEHLKQYTAPMIKRLEKLEQARPVGNENLQGL